MDRNLAQGAGPQDQGLDIDGQIRAGVEAYKQSGDPAIAVEVVEMLAQMMGIAPEVDPYAGQEDFAAQQATPAQAPMASSGMRIYKNGGKIKKYAKGGKPAPKKGVTSQLTAPSTATGTTFESQDMNSGSVKSRSTNDKLVKDLKENPAKGSKRQQLQMAAGAGQDIAPLGGYMIGDRIAYDWGGRKGELAGQVRNIQFDVPGFQHTLPALDVPDYPATVTPETTEETPPGLTIEEIRAKGKFGKGDAAPLPWIKGKTSKGGYRATKNYSYKSRAKKNLGR